MVISYLGRKGITLIAGPESPFCHLSVVSVAARQIKKEDGASIREGFSERFVQICNDNELSLWRVPVLDLGGRERNGDYIDFLDPEDMPPGASIARFKDSRGRLGFALHVQGNVDGEFPYCPQMKHGKMVGVLNKKGPFRNLNGVVTIHEYFGPGDMWKHQHKLWTSGSVDFTEIVEATYSEVVIGKEAEKYHFTMGARYLEDSFRVQVDFIERMLAGTDPAFRLADGVRQIEQPLPNEPEPAPDAVEREQTCWEQFACCITAICEGIFFALSALFACLVRCFCSENEAQQH